MPRSAGLYCFQDGAKVSAGSNDAARSVASVSSTELERLLAAGNAHSIPHSGRTLLDHLVGTYWLLSDWECEEHVCLAGLVHSAYGTASLSHTTVPVTERAKLKRLVGREAERLAYLFSACTTTADRVRAVAKGTIRSRYDGREIDVSVEDARKVLVIECANLIEQRAADGLRQVLGKLGPDGRTALLGSNAATALESSAATTEAG